mgnify:CR=1 FL=1
MSMTAIAVCLIAAAVIIGVLRRSSETRIELPKEADAVPPHGSAGRKGGADEKEAAVYYRLKQPAIQELDGVGFVADMYSDETVTIEIHLKDKFDKPFELNARDGAKPELPAGERGRIAAELLAIGSDYIDAGYNTDRVAAEFPARKLPSEPAQEPPSEPGVPSRSSWESGPPQALREIVLDRVMLEKTVRLLVRLKDSKAQV